MQKPFLTVQILLIDLQRVRSTFGKYLDKKRFFYLNLNLEFALDTIDYNYDAKETFL